ncbi:MAG: hypothetical protein LAP40_16795 [Acidobacteriia bacterium]|nr:hypothetical protein [Terriglobia bacterium]
MSILKWGWGLVVHNFWWRVLALALAITIWAMVASEPELSMFATVPLEYRNLPDDIEMSSPASETVTLELRGPSAELRGLGDSRSPAVVLDMADATPGVRTYSIEDQSVRLARGVRLVRAIPSEVRFDFDRRLTRTIPVKVRFTDAPAGYKVTDYSVAPDQMTIAGPSRHVERVVSALTDPVAVSSVAGTSVFRVSAFLDDAYVRFQSSPDVVVTVTVKKNLR